MVCLWKNEKCGEIWEIWVNMRKMSKFGKCEEISCEEIW